ncbi:hypothetical protein, partial [Rothia nasimurium]|uniref:hypothetical protein n=1 Tax=Rothia nasimurium TaxID=85336 RepID=UPI001F1F7FDD
LHSKMLASTIQFSNNNPIPLKATKQTSLTTTLVPGDPESNKPHGLLPQNPKAHQNYTQTHQRSTHPKEQAQHQN